MESNRSQNALTSLFLINYQQSENYKQLICSVVSNYPWVFSMHRIWP